MRRRSCVFLHQSHISSYLICFLSLRCDPPTQAVQISYILSIISYRLPCHCCCCVFALIVVNLWCLSHESFFVLIQRLLLLLLLSSHVARTIANKCVRRRWLTPKYILMSHIYQVRGFVRLSLVPRFAMVNLRYAALTCCTSLYVQFHHYWFPYLCSSSACQHSFPPPFGFWCVCSIPTKARQRYKARNFSFPHAQSSSSSHYPNVAARSIDQLHFAVRVENPPAQFRNTRLIVSSHPWIWRMLWNGWLHGFWLVMNLLLLFD